MEYGGILFTRNAKKYYAITCVFFCIFALHLKSRQYNAVKYLPCNTDRSRDLEVLWGFLILKDMLKKCKVCNVEKSYNDFYKRKQGDDKYRNECKECKFKYTKKYKEENKEVISERRRNRYERNKEKELRQRKEYVIKNKEKVAEISKIYYEKNKDVILKKSKENYNKNKKQRIAKGAEYSKKRKKVDPVYKFKVNLRDTIRASFKRSKNNFSKSVSTEKIIGCKMSEFVKYIESKFRDGMTWENRGLKGWHLDHVIPLCTAKTIEDVIKLNHYTNFQPLWAEDNLKKGSKIL
jgi:hypothetical protein